jgi:hypothetical protein
LELHQQELRAAKEEQEPVAVLENGMSRSPLYLDHDGYTYSPDASFSNVSPAISKFRNVYEQIEDTFVRVRILGGLWEIAVFFRHTDDDTCRQRRIERRFHIAMWFGPVSQLGCCRRLLYLHGLHIPAEWREQVEELVVALKALTAAQASLMSWEMEELLLRELLGPQIFRQVYGPPALADEKGKEEMCTKTESTDSDSCSTY